MHLLNPNELRFIAVDVRRFGHAINTDKVFGTHRGQPAHGTARDALARLWTVALTAAICFSVASFIMRRSVKPHQAIISAPVQGVMTGTVASVARGPSEDRSSGLVSTQAGAFILAASVGGLVGGLYRGGGREPKLLVPDPAGRL